MPSLTESVDVRRLTTNSRLEPRAKSTLGQFMTPRPVARFMASLFGEAGSGPIKLLDAGAGVGSLTAAFVEEFCQRDSHVSSIVATAYEVDPIMEEALKTTLAECGQVCQSAGIRFDSHLSKEDFVPVRHFAAFYQSWSAISRNLDRIKVYTCNIEPTLQEDPQRFHS